MKTRPSQALWLAAVIAALPCLAPTASGQNPSFLEQLDQNVPALLKKYNEPGIAVVFVDNCLASIRYGVANREKETPVRADTVFNLGSISKTLTAWTVMTLVTRRPCGSG